MRLFALLLLVLTLARPARADDAGFEFLGFSADGTHAAVLHDVSTGESNDMLARVIVLDVDKNETAGAVIDKKGSTRAAARAAALKAAAKALKKAGVDKSLQGEDGLTEHQLYLGYVMNPAAPHCVHDPDRPLRGLDVTLTSNKTNERKTIQKDAAIPKSRGCPSHYEIRTIRRHAGRFVAVIRTYQSPDEGEDQHGYMALSGTLN